ncbi:MAG: PAS domain-containing protein [Gammaproteobacteria bacterium]
MSDDSELGAGLEPVAAATSSAGNEGHERELLERLSVAIQAAGLSCWEFCHLTKQFTWVDQLPDGTDGSGLSGEQANQAVQDSLIPEEAATVQAAAAKALAAGENTLSSRMRRIGPDGRIQHVQIYQRFFRDGQGRPTRALGATRDVTEEVEKAERLKQQAEQLAEAQRRLERASHSVQEGHWEIDLLHRKHWASSNYYALLGYAPGEIALESVDDLHSIVHPEDYARATRTAQEHISMGAAHDLEIRVRCKSGDYRWFRVRGNAERDADGVAIRVSGSIHDIHKQKVAEDALHEVKARFERAIHGTQDGLWEVDRLIGKLWLSPRMHHLLGFADGELGDHLSALRDRMHPDDLPVREAAVSSNFNEGRSADYEVRILTKAGEYRWFRLRGTPSVASDGQVQRVSGSMHDVTEAREARDALIRASEAAQAANQAKSAFLANVSHEIRTPMNGIIGMTTLLLDTPLDDTQREFADTIRASADSLLNVINDILDFSKIEAGKLDIEFVEMDLAQCIRDVGTSMSFQAEAKGLQLAVNVHPEVPVRAVGDGQRIRQCLINLLGNAIKFTPTGQVSVEVSVVSVRDGVALTRFEVRDSGIGIAPETVKSLFQPFVQADSSTTRHFGGTGLGLSIVRRLVEMMGGEVGAASELGKGSRFWFCLPLKKVEGSAASDARGTPSRVELTRRYSGRVLLVEDNPVNQKVASRFLQRLGCEVTLVENGVDCLKEWEGGEFDLVLMDVQMPLMDGYTATRRIRELEQRGRPRTCIFALTANAMTGELEKCLECGMDGLLTKPLAMDELRGVLDRCGLAVESAAAAVRNA